MRKQYKYKTVRYFPNIETDEFFNIGIYLYENENENLLMLTDEHLAKLEDCPLISKEKVEKFISIIKKEKNLNSWYANYLRFSEEKQVVSSKSYQEILQELYNDEVGYKFIYDNSKISILEKEIEVLKNENQEKDFHIQGLSIFSSAILDTLKKRYK